METPITYKKLLKQGKVTADMVAAAIFSVSKRAKNCRDQERAYSGYSRFNYSDNYTEKKQEYYRMKDAMLAPFTPTCVHVSTYKKFSRIYDYEDDYQERIKEATRFSCYWDYEEEREVHFYYVPYNYNVYYLFYEFGGHSFHKPIDDPEAYKLPVIPIDNNFFIQGENTAGLLSVQFCKKVLQIVTADNFQQETAF